MSKRENMIKHDDHALKIQPRRKEVEVSLLLLLNSKYSRT